MQVLDANQPSGRFAAFRYWWFAPESRWVRVPLTAFLLTRVIVFIGAYLPLMLGVQLYSNPPDVRPVPGILGVWARWDSNWYVRVADEGYFFSNQPGLEGSVGFFPMYPIVIRSVSILTGGNTLAAGILINNLTFLFALMIFYKLAELDLDGSSTRRAIFYMAAFPGAFFFSAAYSEGLYLLVSLLAVLLARKGSWYWASFWAALCAASRLPGLLIWMVVGLEWLRVHGWTLGSMHRRAAWHNLFHALRTHWAQVLLMTVLMTSGLWLFMLYLQIEFNNPLVFLASGNQGWYEMRFSLLRPLEVIVRDIQQSFSATPPKHVLPGFAAVNVGLFVVVVLMALPIWRRFRDSYAIYAVVHLLLPLFGYTHGMVRYTAVLFPVFMLLGEWGCKPWRDRALMLTFLPLQCLFTAFFVNWVFIG